MLNSGESIQAINSFVRRNIPFLFIISFDCENNLVLPIHELAENHIFFSTPELSNHKAPSSFPKLTSFLKFPVSQLVYQMAFQKVMHEIQSGNTYLLNLTMRTEILPNLGLYELFVASQARYKLYYPDKFVLFSPESFITITDHRIKTFPMKGTIGAEIPNASDTLLNDKKEAAEHATIVDLLRNDLSKVASQVKVNRYRYIEKLQTNDGAILQVSTEIEGLLPENYEEQLGRLFLQCCLPDR